MTSSQLQAPGFGGADALTPTASHAAIPATAQFPAAPPDEGPEEEGANESGILVRRSIAAVIRYKWLIAAITVMAAGAGYVLKGRYGPEYEVEGKVWIAPTGQDAGSSRDGPVRAAALLPSNSWSDLLVSYAVVGEAVRELHLYIRPGEARHERLFASVDVGEAVRAGAYVLRTDSLGVRYRLVALQGREERVVERGAVGDSVGRTIGLRWVPDPALLAREHEVPFSLTTPRAAANGVQASVRAVLPWQGNIMRVYVTGANAWRVSALANALLRHLVARADEFKRRNLTEVRKTLDVQLTFAGNALQEADTALERFRSETITLPPAQPGPDASVGATNYFRLKVALETLAHERAALETTLADVRAGKLDVQALWQVIPTEGGGQDVGTLLQEYARKQGQLRSDLLAFTEDYQGVKDTRAALAQLKDHAIPGMVGTLLEQMRRREADLRQQVDTESASLQTIPPRMVEEVRLTRAVEARRLLFDMLQRRYEEARLAELSVEPDLAILDVAGVPEWPISNRGRQVFLMVTAAGLGGAIVLALMLDRLDKRIRYLPQVPGRLKLRVLGAVPHATRRRTPDPMNIAQIIEAFRSIRLNATYAAAPESTFLLAVTSAGAGEGKSFVSANLALAFAQGGYRTLLIDGDVRRGHLHSSFDADATPGLVDVLRGSASLTDSLVATPHAKLALLPCGTRLKHAPELLTSNAFRELTAALQSSFSVIVIDTPPLAAGMDPFALCAATGHVLFVARMAITDGGVARQKLEVLERFPVRILGAVANDVRTSLGLNQDYSYLPEYAFSDEIEGSPHALHVIH